jgi:1,4-dihydroxy-2-naphthoyl-CoA hydrolase
LGVVTPGAQAGMAVCVTDFPDLSLDGASPFVRTAGLVVDRAGGDLVEGHIDAGPEHHTPWGVVHGGLYTTAAETACSIGASMAVAGDGQFSVGLSNATEFLRAHREGRLDVRAVPVFQGRTGQVWQCDLTREDGKLVAQGRVRLQNVPAG